VKLALGFVFVGGGALCSAPAWAEQLDDEKVLVHWSAPPSCPSEAELKRAIEAHLGQSPGATREHPLAITAHVAQAEGRYAVRLRFDGRSGVEERSLEHPECGKLLDAAALVIALAIDPGRVNAHQPSSGASQVDSPPPTSDGAPAASAPAPPTAEVASPRAVTPRPRPEGERRSERSDAASRPRGPGAPFELPLGVFVLAGTGALPGTGPGLGVDFALARRHFELGVVGRYWSPRGAPVEGPRSSEVSLGWWAAELRACGVPWLGAWRLRLCAAGGGGDLWGRGVGVSNSRTRHTFVPTLSAGALLGYRRGRLSPFVGLAADWLPVQPSYGIVQGSDIVEVHRSSVLALSGMIGLAYRLEQ
jgi:hypothetical protein